MDLRPSLRLSVDREASPGETDALVEADQTQAASAPRLREVEPAPIVTDSEHQVGPVARHGHPNPAGLRMPRSILERFLRHTVEAERDVGGYGSEVVVR